MPLPWQHATRAILALAAYPLEGYFLKGFPKEGLFLKGSYLGRPACLLPWQCAHRGCLGLGYMS